PDRAVGSGGHAVPDERRERFGGGRRADAGDGGVAEDREADRLAHVAAGRRDERVDDVARVERQEFAPRQDDQLRADQASDAPDGRPEREESTAHAPARFHSLPSTNRSRFQIGSRSLIASITNRLA